MKQYLATGCPLHMAMTLLNCSFWANGVLGAQSLAPSF